MAPPDDGLVIGGYTAADDEACLEIDRLAPQGAAWRLSFRRAAFSRRAENFDHHRVLVARLEGRVVGAVACAVKDVVLLGESLKAAFYFDLRVDPACRRRRVGRRLTAAIMDWGRRQADFSYSYFVADNASVRSLSALFGVERAGGFRYLVLPTCRRSAPRTPVTRSTLDDVHEAHLEVVAPYDFHTDPRRGGRTDGWVSSWLAGDGRRRGGASVWDNSAILAEVLERAPLTMRCAARAFRAWPRPGLPRLPLPGERIRSWYLFDVFGTDTEIVVDVVRRVAAEAREQGIDWLYLPHVDGDDWPDAVRGEALSFFAPRVAYDLQATWPRGPFPAIRRPYVDIRDL
jgi:GNAT superfamily N-acetyltransferase